MSAMLRYRARAQEVDVAPQRATAVSRIAPARVAVLGRHPRVGVAPAYQQAVGMPQVQQVPVDEPAVAVAPRVKQAVPVVAAAAVPRHAPQAAAMRA